MGELLGEMASHYLYELIPERLRVPFGIALGTAELAFAIAIALSVWIAGRRLRLRILRATGVNVTSELKLTSLSTWMLIHDIERKRGVGNPTEHRQS